MFSQLEKSVVVPMGEENAAMAGIAGTMSSRDLFSLQAAHHVRAFAADTREKDRMSWIVNVLGADGNVKRPSKRSGTKFSKRSERSENPDTRAG
jgi:hypothetical protein